MYLLQLIFTEIYIFIIILLCILFIADFFTFKIFTKIYKYILIEWISKFPLSYFLFIFF